MTHEITELTVSGLLLTVVGTLWKAYQKALAERDKVLREMNENTRMLMEYLKKNGRP